MKKTKNMKLLKVKFDSLDDKVILRVCCGQHKLLECDVRGVVVGEQ